MLNHSVFVYALAQGQSQPLLRDTSEALPVDTAYCAGVPFGGGRALHSFTLPVTHYHNGMPYCATGALATEEAPAHHFAQGPLGITASGRIAIAVGGIPTHYSRGFPLTDMGQICALGAVPPINTHAFSLGFNQGAFA